MINYLKLRPRNLFSPQFRHLLLLIYWIFYGIIFSTLEAGIVSKYHAVECALDAYIPFCEWFVIPYYFWFVFLVGIHVYTLFFDIPAFKKLMYFIMLTYTVTSIIYVVYPNMQLLRPTEFPRDNLFIDIVKGLYGYDTNTNVCPSLHVVGSFAVYFTAINSKHFKTKMWNIIYLVVTILISASTVFLKQHSIIDVFAALVLCVIAYPICYILPDRLKKKENLKEEIKDEQQEEVLSNK